MEKTTLEMMLDAQRAYFQSGATLPISIRKEALRRLKKAIADYESDILMALQNDLGKSSSESMMCEIGLVNSEISYMLKHLSGFAREKHRHTVLTNAVAKSSVLPSPYGNVLIMSPWNYPFLLTIEPLIDALAAGNTAILKPSAYSPKTTEMICRLIADCFDPRYVACVTGGREENQSLLELKFDYIFFTGGKTVGREVMRMASAHLTPITLELGGKSPCIVDESANIKMAARRLIFGKLINCGQTCVAPDYIYCHESVKDQLITAMVSEIHRQYGNYPLANKTFGHIVNEKHFNRLCRLIDDSKVVCGGRRDEEAHRISPTIMDHITWDDPVMKEEIFGPIFPVLTYTDLDEVISKIQSEPSPLAFYIFSSDKAVIKKLKTRISFGGGCVNDTIIHLATSNMGFGGVGESGMGAYHGKTGFDTFSHHKSIVSKAVAIDVPLRYQPYSARKDKLIHFFLK